MIAFLLGPAMGLGYGPNGTSSQCQETGTGRAMRGHDSNVRTLTRPFQRESIAASRPTGTLPSASRSTALNVAQVQRWSDQRCVTLGRHL